MGEFLYEKLNRLEMAPIMPYCLRIFGPDLQCWCAIFTWLSCVDHDKYCGSWWLLQFAVNDDHLFYVNANVDVVLIYVEIGVFLFKKLNRLEIEMASPMLVLCALR